MSFTTAKKEFDSALQLAQAEGNHALEHLLLGMIELTQAIKKTLGDIDGDIKSIR